MLSMPYNIMVGLEIENINMPEKHEYLAPRGTAKYTQINHSLHEGFIRTNIDGTSKI